MSNSSENSCDNTKSYSGYLGISNTPQMTFLRKKTCASRFGLTISVPYALITFIAMTTSKGNVYEVFRIFVVWLLLLMLAMLLSWSMANKISSASLWRSFLWLFVINFILGAFLGGLSVIGMWIDDAQIGKRPSAFECLTGLLFGQIAILPVSLIGFIVSRASLKKKNLILY